MSKIIITVTATSGREFTTTIRNNFDYHPLYRKGSCLHNSVNFAIQKLFGKNACIFLDSILNCTGDKQIDLLTIKIECAGFEPEVINYAPLRAELKQMKQL